MDEARSTGRGVDFVLVCGYVADHDVFVLWDAALRIDFAYSTNLQVRTANVEAAAASGARVRQDRRLKTGMEVVICAPSQSVVEAIEERASSGEVGSRGTSAPGSGWTALHAPSARWLRHPSGRGSSDSILMRSTAERTHTRRFRTN